MILDCQEAKILLNAYIDKSLSDEDKKLVELHIKECVRCKNDLDALFKTSKLIKQLDRVQAPPHLAYQIRTRIEEESKRSFWEAFAPKNLLSFSYARQVGLVFVLVLLLTYITFTLIVPVSKESKQIAQKAPAFKKSKAPETSMPDFAPEIEGDKVIQISPKSRIESEEKDLGSTEGLHSLGYMKRSAPAVEKKKAEVSRTSPTRESAELEEQRKEKADTEVVYEMKKSNEAYKATEQIPEKEIPAVISKEDSQIARTQLPAESVESKPTTPEVAAAPPLQKIAKADKITITACPVLDGIETGSGTHSLKHEIDKGYYGEKDKSADMPAGKDKKELAQREKTQIEESTTESAQIVQDKLSKGETIISIRFNYIYERPRKIVAEVKFNELMELTYVKLLVHMNDEDINPYIIESLKAAKWYDLFSKCAVGPGHYQMQFQLTKAGLILEKVSPSPQSP